MAERFNTGRAKMTRPARRKLIADLMRLKKLAQEKAQEHRREATRYEDQADTFEKIISEISLYLGKYSVISDEKKKIDTR